MALKTRGFAQRIDIAAQPAQVWAALCGPAQMTRWLGADAQIRPQQGGRWMATVAPGFTREAMIDVFQPPRRLRLIYLPPADLPGFDGAVVDDILLEGEGASTVVRLLCSGVPEAAEWSSHFAKVRAAAERALARLKALVEQGELKVTSVRKPA